MAEMKVFAVEERRHGCMWVVQFLHKAGLREVFSHMGILTSKLDWRVRRVETLRDLRIIQKIFKIPLIEYGHKEEIDWLN